MMPQFDTITSASPLGYHDLQRRAELSRRTADRIHSEYLGRIAKQNAPFSRDICRRLVHRLGRHATILAGSFGSGRPA